MEELSKKRNTAGVALANYPTVADVAPSQDSVTIVIVHGFMAPAYSSLPLCHFLRWKGWKKVENFKYDSRAETIEAHGERLAAFIAILAEQRPDDVFYFYCTSMGNLLLRWALQQPNFPERAKSGKHVAVAPPWRGTAWGRFVDHFAVARWVSGSGPGKQLRKTQFNGFDYLGHHPASLSTLVVSGASSYNWFIPTPNDGTVTVEETVLRTPHFRYNFSWGIHGLFSVTPSLFYLAHRFFLGDRSGLEEHPGLDAMESSPENEKSAASSSGSP